MNESCPECGGKVSGCKWDKSNGIDLQTKTNHLDNYLDKNKSWNEFLEWAKDFTKEGNDFFNYYSYENFGKIGLLIEYLKSKGFFETNYIVGQSGCGLSAVALEGAVKSLKPKEDGEIVRLANELYKAGGGNGKLDTPGGIEYWSDIAKRAIEIIKGK